MTTEPTDAELNTILCTHWPAFAMQPTLVKIWVRDALQDAIDKWGRPVIAGDAVATQWLAEMVMSDCGCSTENQRLLDRIIDRIQQYDRANAAPQPVAREPLTDEWIRSRCIESWIFDTAIQWVRMTEAAHGIKGGQHVE